VPGGPPADRSTHHHRGNTSLLARPTSARHRTIRRIRDRTRRIRGGDERIRGEGGQNRARRTPGRPEHAPPPGQRQPAGARSRDTGEVEAEAAPGNGGDLEVGGGGGEGREGGEKGRGEEEDAMTQVVRRLRWPPLPAMVVAIAAVGGAGRRSWRRPVGVPRVAHEGDARVHHGLCSSSGRTVPSVSEYVSFLLLEKQL
jgi:hypothetical protein